MAPPPAVVIVVRHGARLDAADKQWHLKSPTPYDPPLTYGGWNQCRTLGNRIAQLLQAREEIFNAAAQQHEADVANGLTTNKSGKPRRKRHRVIIHSSPFKRCVQTSIAISSGMSQYNGLNGTSKFERSGPPSSGHRGSSRGDRSQERPARSLSMITDDEEYDDVPRARAVSPAQSDTRIKLRVDAFLGEWLSPEYYESITPPPESVLMLAAAKAELLHRAEAIAVEERRPATARKESASAGLWGSPDTQPEQHDLVVEDGMELDPPGRPLPRERSASHSGDDRDPLSARHSTSGSFSHTNGYLPPTPLYAISPQDPIPPGYVAHARDHCVDIDIHWDSMRPPQNWGDGGKYGEEWSSMHRRFRHGLDSMISWYRHHVESSHQRHGHLRTLHPPRPSEEEDADTDTVLILVSHGAGCNALIGALTNQPVLLDIGMASLTMAVRRERALPPSSPPLGPSGRPQHSSHNNEGLLAQEYEVALTASTDHLQRSSASSQASSPLELSAPTTMKLAPGLLQRSNTLPLRPGRDHPPLRKISPAPSKTRSTSLSKVAFAGSPLAQTWGSGSSQAAAEPKTWMENHPALSPSSQPASSLSPHVRDTEPTRPALPRNPISATGAGLWSVKSSSSGPGLWQRPSSIPRSGPGSAVPDAEGPSQKPKEKSRAAFVSPGAPTRDDHRMEQWMVENQNKTLESRDAGRTEASGHHGAKSVKFAALPDKSSSNEDSQRSGESSVSPGTRTPVDNADDADDERDGDETDHDEHGAEELSRWHDEGRAGEHAPRIYKTTSETKLSEMGMKRRWTMNDKRNQETEKKEGDWRMEAWM